MTLVGIDFGMQNFLILSDGLEVFYPLIQERRELSKLIKQIRLTKGIKKTQLQKKLIRLRLKYRTKTFRFIESTVEELLRKYSGFAVEDIQKKGLGRGNLRRAVSLMPWREFIRHLRKRSIERGKRFVMVPAYNTSRTCCKCGTVKTKLTLKERTFNCESCGFSLNRDVNAARVILELGFGLHLVP